MKESYALAIVGAGIVNGAALFLTNSCTLIDRCPVSRHSAV